MLIKKIIAIGIFMVVLAPWQAQGNELRQIVFFLILQPAQPGWKKRPMLETEGEQIGLEWGQLLMQRVLKRFEDQTGEKF